MYLEMCVMLHVFGGMGGESLIPSATRHIEGVMHVVVGVGVAGPSAGSVRAHGRLFHPFFRI